MADAGHQVVCDVVTLDSALQNSYAEHVLSVKALPINYGSYVSQFQTITGGDFAVSITRAVSRLKSVFLPFARDYTSQDATSKLVHKEFNTFVGPMRSADFTAGGYDHAKELQWQLQIGSKMFPEYPARSLAETFYQLKKALGIQGSAFHSVAISPVQYRNDHFIIGVDTERVLESGFSGLNTRAGDLMMIRAKGSNGNMTQWANSIYIILHCDMVSEIRDVGSTVFD